MKALLRLTILLLSATFFSGCFLAPEKEVYLAPGQGAELAENVRVRVWVTNAETGKRERRIYDTKKCPAVHYIDRFDRKLKE